MNNIIAIQISLLLLLVGCSTPQFSEENWKEKVLNQDSELLYAQNFKDGKYFNPWMKENHSFLTVLKWKLSKTDREYTLEEKKYLPSVKKVNLETMLKSPKNFILWVGHCTFLIKLGNTIFLLDPIFTDKALIVSRILPPAFSLEELNSLNIPVNVLISHNHYDHFDTGSLKNLPKQSTIYTPLGYEDFNDAFKSKLEMMGWWEERKVNDVKLTALPAQHWSRRISEGTNKSLWAGYMLEYQEKKLYFAGDTGYFVGFKEFGEKYPGIDYALLPITAYHPRWFMHYNHMNVPEAVDAFEDLQARFFVPTQWGTFKLGDNPPGVPALDLKSEIKKRKLDSDKFLILAIGEAVFF